MLVQLELVEDRRLAGSIEAHHDETCLLLSAKLPHHREEARHRAAVGEEVAHRTTGSSSLGLG